MTNRSYQTLFVVFLCLTYNVNNVGCSGCSGGNTQALGLSQTTVRPAFPWGTYQTPTMYQCAELCMSLEICRSFVFIRNVSECRVYNDIQNVPLTGGSTGVYVIKAGDIPQVIAGLCANHNCPIGTRCVPRNNGYACLQIDLYCDKPPIIAEASIVDLSQAYGATVQYRCTGEGDLYLPQGSPNITCLEGGNWTPTSFHCKEGWICSHWTADDNDNMAFYSQPEVCADHGIIPRRWTAGHNSLAPGCTDCYCCERI